MSSAEFNPQQLVFPLDAREKRVVSWYVVEKEIKKRRFGLGEKAVWNAVWDDRMALATQAIDSGDISKIKDPDLAYALRLADVANAMGWIYDSPGSAHHNDVTIEATGDEFDSAIASVRYYGLPGKFEEDLQKFDPKYEDN